MPRLASRTTAYCTAHFDAAARLVQALAVLAADLRSFALFCAPRASLESAEYLRIATTTALYRGTNCNSRGLPLDGLRCAAGMCQFKLVVLFKIENGRGERDD
jgi:hypothetical protein